MSQYSRTHLSDAVLLCDLAAHAAQESTATATLLADLAEVDARKLYRGTVKKCVNDSGGDLLIRFADSHSIHVDHASVDLGCQVGGVQLAEVPLS